uniref:Uncharacterized protein n=1 Tax=Anguilla anguilla TaxID=7936 RepID=A0A0E9T9D4_ANGAN
MKRRCILQPSSQGAFLGVTSFQDWCDTLMSTVRFRAFVFGWC